MGKTKKRKNKLWQLESAIIFNGSKPVVIQTQEFSKAKIEARKKIDEMREKKLDEKAAEWGYD